MPTASISIVADGGGVSITGKVARTSQTVPAVEVALPVGKAGTLTTRTDDNTGTATLGAGHGILTGDVVDIYWSGGVQYNVVVGTVSGTSVPFDTGVGDVLPAAATAIVMTKQVVITHTIDGDSLAALVAMLEVASGSTGKGHLTMEDAANDVIAELDMVGNEPQVLYMSSTSIANPFTGDVITETRASNGSATVAATLKIIPALTIAS